MPLDDYRRFYAEEIGQVASLNSPARVEAFARVPREAMAVAGQMKTSYRTITEPRHLYHNVVGAPDPAKDIDNGQPGALARWIGGNLRDPELEAPLRQTLGKAMATGAMFKLKSLRRAAHQPDESCVFHTPGMCLSTKPTICEDLP